MRTALRLLVVAGAVALGACKPSVVEKYKPQALPKVTALQALAAKPLPPLAADTLRSPGAPLRESGMIAPPGNTAIYGVELLATPSADVNRTNAFDSEFALRDAIAWVGGRPVEKYTPQASVVEHLEALASLRYVFVVRPVEYVRPVVEGASFRPGAFRGEAHLFDLDGTYYGGVRFAAASSSKVDFTKWVDKQSGAERSSDVTASVDYDLKSHAWQAFVDAVHARLADATFMAR
jgi:hypothetical protein